MFAKLILTLMMTFASLEASASGCDWGAHGRPNVTRVESIKAEPQKSLVLWDHRIICISAGFAEDCMPGIQYLWGKEFAPWLPEQSQNRGWYGWWSFTMSAADFKLLQAEFRAGRFKLVLHTENVYGYFDDNCGGGFPELKTGRLRYEFEFQHPKLGVRNFAIPAYITPENMRPLY